MAQRVHPAMIGADVDSRFIEVFDYTTESRQRVENRDPAIRDWLKTLSGPAYLAVEATGRYHHRLVELAHARGITVFVINPQWLYHYRRGVGVRAKTDPCDAQLLARFVAHEHAELRPWSPPPKAQQAAWRLLKRRAKLVQARDMLQQSLADLGGLKREVQAVFKRLQTLEQVIEKQLAAHIDEQGWTSTLRRCQSIYGIGFLSAAALVIAYHRGPFRKADAFVAFLGLDVRVRQSGRFEGQRKLSKQGDAEYRRLLHNAARAAAQGHQRPYYQRLLARGLKPTQAHVAVARKLARIAFGLMTHDVDYDPKRVQPA